MLGIIALSALSLAGYYFLARLFNAGIERRRKDCLRLRERCDALCRENQWLRQSNAALEKSAEETIALYDITAEICRELDEQKVFEVFRAQANKYLPGVGLRLLKERPDAGGVPDSAVLELSVGRSSAGYLAASGVRGGERERFAILAQQFLIGVKHALLYKKAEAMTMTDALTGMSNRRHFSRRLEEEFVRSARNNLEFCFLMLDVDYFKKINDTYGHLVGDAVLKEVAQVIRENVRQIDIIGRWGGEELAVVFAEAGPGQGRFAAERLRQAVEGREICAYDEKLKATVSIGIAGFPRDAKEIQPLIEKADQALYRAKEAGRNKVFG